MKQASYKLVLYVAGTSPKSLEAFSNLKKICEDYLHSHYSINVIDLLKNPSLAKGDQIVAIPTLVRKFPPPVMKIIGNLQNKERVLVGLNIIGPVKSGKKALALKRHKSRNQKS